MKTKEETQQEEPHMYEATKYEDGVMLRPVQKKAKIMLEKIKTGEEAGVEDEN